MYPPVSTPPASVSIGRAIVIHSGAQVGGLHIVGALTHHSHWSQQPCASTTTTSTNPTTSTTLPQASHVWSKKKILMEQNVFINTNIVFTTILNGDPFHYQKDKLTNSHKGKKHICFSMVSSPFLFVSILYMIKYFTYAYVIVFCTNFKGAD